MFRYILYRLNNLAINCWLYGNNDDSFRVMNPQGYKLITIYIYFIGSSGVNRNLGK